MWIYVTFRKSASFHAMKPMKLHFPVDRPSSNVNFYSAIPHSVILFLTVPKISYSMILITLWNFFSKLFCIVLSESCYGDVCGMFFFLAVAISIMLAKDPEVVALACNMRKTEVIKYLIGCIQKFSFFIEEYSIRDLRL